MDLIVGGLLNHAIFIYLLSQNLEVGLLCFQTTNELHYCLLGRRQRHTFSGTLVLATLAVVVLQYKTHFAKTKPLLYTHCAM